MSGQSLPYFIRGKVVKGFGRGSKELGCPTANFDDEIVNNVSEDLSTGVYYGFGQVNGGQIHEMVMSVGWNPFYHNSKKSIEVHLLHKFEADFYGKELRIVILGFLRAEKNFVSLDELIKAIEYDIMTAKDALKKQENAVFKSNPFFS
ncbi:riboflavin kinase [Euwallacea fornicatus]|uniref:riboflavin kinase n=1 Tax=Euwallacea fornicatus TaxID=995702 RepID=UPI00338E7492